MKTALQFINDQLREEGTHYTFEDLRDRFESALDEALRYGDDFVTIKIPSGSEFSAERSLVSTAMVATRGFENVVRRFI